MTHTLLLEVGLEEMPARFMQATSDQFVKRIKNFLDDSRLSYEDIKPYSTPRRFTVQVFGVSERQEDLSEHVKGPAEAIAKDADGNWTKAAEGFARGQGLTVDDLIFEELDGKSYVFIDKITEGKDALDALVDIKDPITSMTFPVTMRWGSNSFEYIRPIHWIAAMLDDEVIPFDILDVTSGNEVAGHRFLGERAVLNHANDYEKALEEQYVIPDRSKRKQMIVDQIFELEKEEQFSVADNPDLLDEVTDLVEYPTAFVGNYAEDFLKLPEEVLVTSMQDHQRYFAVYDEEGNILPKFVSVRNGNEEHLDNVISGNEKVLVARLADGLFFYEDDQKQGIDYFQDRLDKVVFHDGLGTMDQKVARIREITKIIGDNVGLSSEELNDTNRAAELSKFDLTTGMVDEFSELQGNMGGIYAKLAGENDTVSTAIYEHYQPTSSDGELPSTTVSSIVALADKMDNLIMYFGAGMIPTGSNDPYALRRQAYGILRIMVENDWHVNMVELIKQITQEVTFPTDTFAEGIVTNEEALNTFFKGRIRQYLEKDKVPHDVIEAALASSKHNFLDIIENAEILTNHKNDTDYKDFVEQTSRVLNLYTKAEELGYVDTAIDVDNLASDSEKVLVEAVNNFDTESDAETYYQKLVELNSLIADFFDNNMVMSDNKEEKANRLSLIHKLGDIILDFARTDQLVIQ